MCLKGTKEGILPLYMPTCWGKGLSEGMGTGISWKNTCRETNPPHVPLCPSVKLLMAIGTFAIIHNMFFKAFHLLLLAIKTNISGSHSG